ncbi:ubiquitin carboxyl-terminal hydrolase 10-like [Paramacrobiotus metropolitanus]|uniref:ubiquitin carboxyl-terminal hydrolase 10-like n=1 Tax=Paramacrobiotus metropolitanus TaxID=2943436 RepID=UPI002445C09A|nr:ubiquitin carboxyl-terminal hydrolase 10-like [Paramacrobiotus metropolitanus]
MADTAGSEILISEAVAALEESGSSADTVTSPPTAVVPAPKKSWAALVRGPDEAKPSAQSVQTSGQSSATAKRPAVTPYVITSEEGKQQRERDKLINLGELVVGKNLINVEINHRTIFLTPRGMINRGNACYANAVLQTLVFCPPFFRLMEALDVDTEDFDRLYAFLPPVTACFAQLVKEFNKIPSNLARKTQLGREEPPLDPSFVYETLERHGTASQQQMLSKGNQEDAQEFLNHVLLLIHEEMVKGVASVEKVSGPDRYTAENGSDEWTNVGSNQKKSIVREFADFTDSPLSRLFCGKLRSIRKQPGAKDFGSVEPFFMLDLPIQDPRVRTVFGALERFMQQENLHGFQDSKGRTVPATRRYQFEQLPAILILHLKYFEFSSNGGLAKLQKPMDFEPVLRLQERWFASGHFQPSKSVYKLSAVVFHYGEGTENGHYTACLFHPSSQAGWIEANDSLISVVSFDYMRRSQLHRVPYLLFYRMQPDF